MEDDDGTTVLLFDIYKRNKEKNQIYSIGGFGGIIAFMSRL
jgi:hypothetical protein